MLDLRVSSATTRWSTATPYGALAELHRTCWTSQSTQGQPNPENRAATRTHEAINHKGKVGRGVCGKSCSECFKAGCSVKPQVLHESTVSSRVANCPPREYAGMPVREQCLPWQGALTMSKRVDCSLNCLHVTHFTHIGLPTVTASLTAAQSNTSFVHRGAYLLTTCMVQDHCALDKQLNGFIMTAKIYIV
jgi:cytochrome c5